MQRDGAETGRSEGRFWELEVKQHHEDFVAVLPSGHVSSPVAKRGTQTRVTGQPAGWGAADGS